ncbi:MAG: hypothetical protein PWP52_2351, partial [Bacteroidales bacterium]|nr:hypothetical protein [Bacteroidales bacterium]
YATGMEATVKNVNIKAIIANTTTA